MSGHNYGQQEETGVSTTRASFNVTEWLPDRVTDEICELVDRITSYNVSADHPRTERQSQRYEKALNELLRLALERDLDEYDDQTNHTLDDEYDIYADHDLYKYHFDEGDLTKTKGVADELNAALDVSKTALAARELLTRAFAEDTNAELVAMS